TCATTRSPGAASSRRVSSRATAVPSRSTTAIGRSRITPAENWIATTAISSNGTQITSARSQKLVARKRISRRSALPKAFPTLLCRPVEQHGHARPQRHDWRDGHNANLKALDIEAARLPRCPPGRKVASRRRIDHAEARAQIAKRGDCAAQFFAAGEAVELILAHVQRHPWMGGIGEREHRKTLRHQFTGLG